MSQYGKHQSISERRGSVLGEELSLNTHSAKLAQQHRPQPPLTPLGMNPSADFNQQLSAGSPPPPPTPAASPGPSQTRPDWGNAEEDVIPTSSILQEIFVKASSQDQRRLIEDLINLCTSQQLSFILQLVSPRLKKDPMTSLPDELCLRVRSAPCCLGRLASLLTPKTDSVIYRRPQGPCKSFASVSQVAGPGERRYDLEKFVSEARLSA